LIEWFNRHDFTKQGVQIGNKILAGMEKSGTAKGLGQFLITIIEDAGVKAWHQFVALFWDAKHAINRAGQQLDTEVGDAIKRMASEVWNWFKSKALAAIHAVVGAFSSVLAAIKRLPAPIRILVNIVAGPLLGAFGAVLGMIGSIVGGIQSAIGAAKSLVGALGGAGGTTGRNPSPPGGGGWNPGNPSGKIAFAGGGPQIHIHYHAPVIGEREINATIQKALRANARSGNTSLVGGLKLR
jgi:hypothetical protein